MMSLGGEIITIAPIRPKATIMGSTQNLSGSLPHPLAAVGHQPLAAILLSKFGEGDTERQRGGGEVKQA
jgi:hypothetical protein